MPVPSWLCVATAVASSVLLVALVVDVVAFSDWLNALWAALMLAVVATWTVSMRRSGRL